MSEIGYQAGGDAARGANGISREQAAKIKHIEHVGKVRCVDLQPQIRAFGLIKIGARRRVDLKRRIDAPAVEVDAAQDRLSVSRENSGRVAIELERKAAIELNSAGDPQARHNLVTKRGRGWYCADLESPGNGR